VRTLNVGLVGYGSQGRRIAEAVFVQKDMKLTGICLKEPDLSAHMAAAKKLPIYVINKEDSQAFKKEEIEVMGSISHFLSETDVIVDATPAGAGKKNKNAFYSKHKAIFQGGESFDIADIPVFISKIGYETAKKANYVRIPTPYTVALMRILEPLNAELAIEEIFGVFIRSSSEPMRAEFGQVDTIVPDDTRISQLIQDEIHYIMPKPTTLSSFKVPSILLDVGSVVVRLEKKASIDSVKKLLSKSGRTVIVKGEKGLCSTDSIFEYVRRTVRPSGDIYEVCIWDEQIEITNNKLKLVQVFDPHCVQTPEIIDAIRALKGEEKMEESFNRANKALRLLKPRTYP
jgi:glyceraldehyde-3-phosphate dehydrogenase (NAD(P))